MPVFSRCNPQLGMRFFFAKASSGEGSVVNNSANKEHLLNPAIGSAQRPAEKKSWFQQKLTKICGRQSKNFSSVTAGSPSKLVNHATANYSKSSSSNLLATWRRKVVQKFRKPKSCPIDIAASGEGATIGVPLGSCQPSSFSNNVPWIVELCVETVEALGINTVGVYRLSGNSVTVKALTASVNGGLHNMDSSDQRWKDVKAVSTLLKSFFRQLPDPLMTSHMYDAFVKAIQLDVESERLSAVKQLVDSLPEPHFSTLHYLLRHLSRVASHSALNKMDVSNLSIVFGPTLMRPPVHSTSTMVADMALQCRVVETLIDHVDYFFPLNELCLKDISCKSSTLIETLAEDHNARTREIVASLISAAHASLDSGSMNGESGIGASLASLTDIDASTDPSSFSSGTPATPVKELECYEDTATESAVITGTELQETALPQLTVEVLVHSNTNSIISERIHFSEQEAMFMVERGLAARRARAWSSGLGLKT